MKPFSASQLKSFNGCQVRWGFERMEGRRGEQGFNAIRGTAVHAELERWYGRKSYQGKNLNLFLPKSTEACALMVYVGNVDMLVEVPLSFERKASWIGFIDGVIFEGDTVYLIDWKTTGNIQYAMNEDQLRDDVAANLYAYEAFEGGAARVVLRWIYIEFGSQSPRETSIEMNRDKVYARVGDYDDRAAYANKLKLAHKRGLLNVLDLPKDPSHCYDFKAECPYKSECKPQSDRRPLLLKGRNQMSTSFENQVNEVTGGERKAPPALPGKKGPPALPGKKPPALPGKSPVSAALETAAGDTPRTENGTFNAPRPNDVKALAATPEEAAKNQDIKAPVASGEQPAGEEKDDLDSMDVAQLKALATALGIEFTPKARAATVIGLIRSKRAHEAVDNEEDPEAHITPITIISQEGVTEQDMGSIPAVDLTQPLDTAKLAAVVAEKKAAPKLPARGGARLKLVPEQEVDADGDAVESDAGFVLYINCAPAAAHTTLSSIIGRFEADLHEAAGVSDYRADSALTGFGKGKGIIAEALNDEIVTGRVSGAVVVDSRTAEGSEFVGILERHAVLVVRGF